MGRQEMPTEFWCRERPLGKQKMGG